GLPRLRRCSPAPAPGGRRMGLGVGPALPTLGPPSTHTRRGRRPLVPPPPRCIAQGYPAPSMVNLRRVCVFCGSSPGRRPEYREAARAMGVELVGQGIGLVYGGGGIGLMGEVADAVLAGGGEVIGVIPRHMTSREVAHQGLSDLRVVAR